MSPVHLAQLNVATLLEPLDHPASAGFAEGLDAMNALGESSPGFVWRLQTEEGDATALRVFPDPSTIVNLTLWEGIEPLREYAYRTEHAGFVRRRAEWFAARTPSEPHLVLFWVPAGHRPTPDEARVRLEHLRDHGPSAFAFTFAGASVHAAPPLTVHYVALDGGEGEAGDPGDAADPWGTRDARALIAALDAELAATYPAPGANHTRLDPHEVAAGAGAFLLVRHGDEPVACGAVRLTDEPAGAAEVKRMYTRPQSRGSHLGAAVLRLLEMEARLLGATSMVLETGPESHAAIATYTGAGFEPCDCWGEYLATPDTSVCLHKPLT